MSNRIIYKYALELDQGSVTLTMPVGAQILSVQMQNGVPCLWAAVHPNAAKIKREFIWRWTGEPEPSACLYVGTIQHAGLVWHLYAS